MNNIFKILLCLLIWHANSFAQSVTTSDKCQSNQAQEKLDKKYPKMKLAREIQEKEFLKQNKINGYQKLPVTHTIPIVFHIVHGGGAENVTDSQIQEAVELINEDFNGQDLDRESVVPAFKNLYADVGFKFVLARLDPNGNPTDGITRNLDKANTNQTNGGEGAMKNKYRWPRDKYLNVYVLRAAGLESGSAWAYLPGVNETFDGVVSSHWAVGRTGTATPTHYKIMTHEIGHWANLNHTFNGGCSGNGDNVSDTPPCTTGSGCNLTDAPCGTLANRQNYMDYGDCTVMFTEGQKARMVAALNGSASSRNNLSTTQNLTATGVIGQPVSALFSIDKNFTTPGGSISFDEKSEAEVGNITSWAWSFPGGTPDSHNGKTPPDITYNTAGVYDVTLTVSNGSSSNRVVKKNYVNVSTNIYMHDNTLVIDQGKLYDDAFDGRYSVREDHTLTLLPKTSGAKISANFTTFRLFNEGTCGAPLENDFLKIYDGPNDSSPLIGTYCASNSPGTITATNAQGALTFYFHTNVSNRQEGFLADISSVTSQDTEAPSTPIGLAASNIAQTSLNLNWTASTDNVAVTGYDIYQGSNVITTVTSTNYTVTGLTANTAYQFRVKAKDAAGNESGFSNTVNVTTESDIGNDYCSMNGTNTGEDSIANVTFAGINNSSSNSTTGYEDFTAIQGNVDPGTSVNLRVTIVGYQGGANNEVYAWFDWNLNKDFNDPGEKYSITTAPSGTVRESVINVPANAVGGTNVRMRVVVGYNASDGDSACGTITYGEVEDYTIYIGGDAPTCNDGIQNGDETGIDCGGSCEPCIAEPSCTDGIQNGDETGIDCGGSCPNPCPIDVTYCSATGNAGPEGVSNVTFAGINNASVRNASGYDDFITVSGNVSAGTSYNLNVTIIGYQGGSTDEIYAWIDWNIDGDFEDAGEFFEVTKTTNLTGEISITVPQTAKNGTTRMRLLVSYYDNENNPCDTGTNDARYGEYEDYSLVVSGGITAGKSDIVTTRSMVYPNPFTNSITLDISNLDNDGKVTVRIVDITGKVIARKEYQKNTEIITMNEVGSLKSGTYFMKIQTNTKTEILSIVKGEK
ncbi:GEVED domain-containing protein [Aquimarina sp. 2201CG1-2-11]|uniref:GEVED domain-containing protein n=1 Tax=Aquimarina discodermiae TaxID=3231043 RepID=UPI0034625445